MRSLCLGIILGVLLPAAIFAQQVEYDLSVASGDISFVPTRLVAGSTVRIYASIRNQGNKDATASVTFFQGDVAIGAPQPVSVRSGGNSDEIFVDFTVPQGAFNVRAEIRNQTPRDDNTSNDNATTALVTPEPDSDRDGLVDANDNCALVANVDQRDTDHDGRGDVCDEDADNDGLVVGEESAKGTDPLKMDTDGDGVNDKDDVYPLDATRSALPPPPPPKPKPVAKVVVPPKEPAKKVVAAPKPKEEPVVVVPQEVNLDDNLLSPLVVSPPEEPKTPKEPAEAPQAFFSFQRGPIRVVFSFLLGIFLLSSIMWGWLLRKG